MFKSAQQFLVSASVLASIGAIATAPAFAVGFTGTASGPNLYYESNGTNTTLGGVNVTNVTLGGNSSTPGNNLELGGTTLHSSTANFSTASTLSGMIGSQAITLSSMTALDWFGEGLNQTYGANNFANSWFNAALDAYSFNALQGAAPSLTRSGLFTTFLSAGGFQRASDPNISYVNQADGQIKIGLAGHFTLNNEINLFLNSLKLGGLIPFVPQNVQLSEVVKVTYGGETGYYSSVVATGSGQFDRADGVSHNGNYEITLAAIPTVPEDSASVPEPSLMLGLLGVGGMISLKRKKQLDSKSA